MNKTLITGTNGFLANRMLDFVDGEKFGISRANNYKVKEQKCNVLYGDILDLEFLKRVISDFEIDTIYHLAAQSIVRIANTNPLNCFSSNVTGTVTVLEAVRQINPNIRVLCASSDKSYGEHEILPYTEDFALLAGDVYSTSKACGDLVAQSYAKSYGLNISIVRSANIYGAGDMNLSRIIPNTITRILRNQKPIIYSGVMDFRREFIYVDDVCKAYSFLKYNGVKGEAYNVGTGHVYQIKGLIEMICEKMNWKKGIEIVEKSFPEITTQFLSSEKINSLGYVAKINIEQGIEKAIDWYTKKMKA